MREGWLRRFRRGDTRVDGRKAVGMAGRRGMEKRRKS